MKKTILKRILALACVLAMLLSFAACGKKDEGGIPFKEGETFTVAVAQTPDSFNPVLSQGGLAEEFFLLCYDPLWRINAAGEPVECLVETYSLSSDQLTWTIRLKKGVTFADGKGTELTSEDVLFSYEMLRSYADLYDGYFDGIRDIRCPDDYTVVISTEYVKGDLMYSPIPILPSAIWDDYEFSPENYENASLIGTGPFVYDAAASGEEGWVFRAREDYHMGPANIGTLVFGSYTTVTSAARAVTAGEVDASYGLTDVQLTTLEGVPGAELVSAMRPQGECWALVFNLQSELFANTAMRQVVEYCADREWILSMACGGAGMTGGSFAVPGNDYFAQPAGILPYSPETGLSNLRAAGYMDLDGNGYLENAREETLRITMFTSNRDSWAATAGTILSNELTEIGVKINWKKTDAAVEEACSDPDDWHMCLTSWRGDRNPVAAAKSFREQMEELTGWNSGSFDGVLEQLRTAMDRETIHALAGQLQQIVYNEYPCVSLAYSADVQVIFREQWTGFEDILAEAGGLFGMGFYDTYMQVMPAGVEE